MPRSEIDFQIRNATHSEIFRLHMYDFEYRYYIWDKGSTCDSKILAV